MGFLVLVLIVLIIAFVVAALMDRDANLKREAETTNRLRDALDRRGLTVSDEDLARTVRKEISVDDLIARASEKGPQASRGATDNAAEPAPDQATDHALAALRDRVSKL